ncbi:transglutaminase-like domain-containing protein [Anatilimnocola floriformis]|uniref:transglutaminase-like domain-containing protein n=1 Tax=Anatilimnocola floriformis TaxID=2948575 RepID=UPI0020C2AC91|nr:transglutaminase-like domain-containing protein [Anatilimnocola floriformis]
MRRKLLNIAGLLLVLAAVVGCQNSPQSELPAATTARQPAVQPVAGPVAGPVAPVIAGPAIRDEWSAIKMKDRKIGWSHLVVRKVKENGQELLHSENISELAIRREKDSLLQRLQLQTWETLAGQVVRFESRMSSGTGEITAEGQTANGGLIVTTNTHGKTVKNFTALPENCGGFFAAEQSLLKKPLVAGEKRVVHGIVPIFSQPGEAQLTAGDEEEVSIDGLKQKLLKVTSEVKIAGQAVTTFNWANDKGEILRSFDPTFQQETFLTSREIAQSREDVGKIDLLAETTAKLKGELPAVRPLQQAVYSLRLKESAGPKQNIADQFATDEFQQFAAKDDASGELTIALLDRSKPVDEKLRGQKPGAEDSAANSLIQSDDREVIRLATSIAPEETDPWKVAVALEQGVRQHINKRGYAQAFATAAEVVRSHEGDCTEHAVLLAAVCRARRIPARVVLGLVYYPPQQGFAYHMWNEVWIGARWVPLDATVAQGAVGADHIKLRHSNLHGESAYAVMLPLLAVVGRLELEVVSAK